MIKGLYTSALGMTSQMKRLDVVSNNIANSDTTGYKKDFSVTRSFSEELTKRLDDRETFFSPHENRVGKITYGLFVDTVHTDFSAGGLIQTGGKLDAAIHGDGFFSVTVIDGQGNAAERYTRDGAFTLLNDGRLATKDGSTVNGQDGPIILGDGEIEIRTDGSIYLNDEYVDTIRLVNVQNPETLRKIGNNFYSAGDDTVFEEFNGRVEQSILEGSNVNPVSELVEMINVTKIYEANQRMVTIHDNILSKAVSDIGRK